MSAAVLRLPGVEALLRGDHPFQHQVIPDTSVQSTYSDQAYNSSDFQPYNKGWFNVQQDEVRRALNLIDQRGLKREALYDMVFAVDENRPLYVADKVGPPNKILESDCKDTKHTKVEKERRHRHGNWQKSLHQMTPEFAHQAVPLDPNYVNGKYGGGRRLAKNKKKSSSGQPGKDEQLCSIVYTVVLLAIAAQSEHEGRVLAEERAARAERRLHELDPTTRPTTTRKRSFDDDERFDDSCTMLKKHCMALSTFRLPPSPSLTGSLSPSPTPTLSSSSSSDY